MCEELRLPYTSFSSAIEALDFFKKDAKKNTSLLICDYKMPHIDGLEFIQKVQKIHSNLPAILITAHDCSDVAIKALEIGAYDYITKPINLKELSLLSKRAIRQKEIKDQNAELMKKLEGISQKKISFIGKSKLVEDIRSIINKIAKTNANILLTGETGTGKEIVARAIHEQSERSEQKMVAINCASIPANLLESEFFGHVKGAFTGADKDKIGLFELAHGSTIFLDEIGDMPFELQSKLLRVLQEGKIRKIGENKEKKIDVRVIAATHNNLIEKIKENKFREDLYYRLNVINIKLPSLRSRKEDIPLLADHFMRKSNKKNKKGDKKTISHKALLKLMTYDWPGNVRELENTIERAFIMSNEAEISEESIFFGEATNIDSFEQQEFQKLRSLAELEKEYISFILQHTNHIKEKAASILGINRKTLYRKIKDYELE